MMSALIPGEKSLFLDSGISPVPRSASVLQDSLVFYYIYNQLYLLLSMTHAPFQPKRGQCEGEHLSSHIMTLWAMMQSFIVWD